MNIVWRAGQDGAGRIGRAFATLQNPGCGQQLGTMANRCHWLVSLEKMANQILYILVKPQVLRCATAGHHQCVVVRGVQPVKIRVQGEPVPRFFGVGLVTLEIMDSGGNCVAGFLVLEPNGSLTSRIALLLSYWKCLDFSV